MVTCEFHGDFYGRDTHKRVLTAMSLVLGYMNKVVGSTLVRGQLMLASFWLGPRAEQATAPDF